MAPLLPRAPIPSSMLSTRGIKFVSQSSECRTLLLFMSSPCMKYATSKSCYGREFMLSRMSFSKPDITDLNRDWPKLFMTRSLDTCSGS
eukprot:6029968-Karenia_brevis.AAC.1